MTYCTACDERDEKIRQLERELYGKDYVPPIKLRLSQTQAAMLGTLLRYDRVVSHELLFEATRTYRTTKIEPDPKLVHVQLFKLREKLRPFQLVIETVCGFGFRLSADTRKRLLNWNERRAA
jgi:DNA-binding response OmpR family regulator